MHVTTKTREHYGRMQARFRDWLRAHAEEEFRLAVGDDNIIDVQRLTSRHVKHYLTFVKMNGRSGTLSYSTLSSQRCVFFHFF